MKSNKERIDIKVNMKKLGLFLLFLVAIFSLTSLYISNNRPVDAATFPSFYFFANSNKADISSGWGTTLAIETSQAFPSGTTLTIDFPDVDDGEWCRTAGSLSIVPVSSAPPDTGGINIDQAMPGTLVGNCTQGVGGGSFDRITINGIGPLLGNVMYGVEIQGNVGVLGTDDTAGGSEIALTLENGVINDDGLFVFALSTNHSVTISARVLPMPVCSDNGDCSYPLQICDGLYQCVACTSDGQCNFGDICVSGACTEDLSCTVPTDCNYGALTCINGTCDNCTQDSQCLSGDRCRNGACEPIPPAECTINTDCNYGNEICDQYRQCNPCTVDSQCSGTDTCESGVCTALPPAQCTSNGQCNYGAEICNGAGICTPCTTDWQCNTGDACVNNVCSKKYECTTNDECRFPDEVCTIDNECDPCTIDEECGQGNVCNSGVCEAEPPAECVQNSQCDYPFSVCGDGICLTCNSEFNCNTGDFCVDGVCEPIPPNECTENDHCNYPGNVCRVEPDPNECAPCENDDECNFGDECRAGRCVEEESPEQLIPVSITTLVNNLLSNISTTASNFADNLFSFTNSGAIATSVSLIASVGIGASLLNIALMDTPVLFTRGLFGLLTLLGLRMKGQPYGYVYNAISKEPLSNAMVRVFTEKVKDSDQRRLVATSVTDAFGVFNAELKPGRYTIKASKTGFRFPSRIVVSLSDYPIDKIYHGDPFDLEKEGRIYYSIPIDPYKQGIMKTISAIIRERFYMFAKFLQLTLTLFGGALSLYLFVTNPGLVNSVILLLYVPGILFTVYSMRAKKPKSGTVVDNENKPVANLTIGLFDEKEQRFLTKRVTDEHGEYRFVAPDGEYHLELIDEPYEIINIDNQHFRSSKNQDLIVIASDITVQKKLVESDYPMDQAEKSGTESSSEEGGESGVESTVEGGGENGEESNLKEGGENGVEGTVEGGGENGAKSNSKEGGENEANSNLKEGGENTDEIKDSIETGMKPDSENDKPPENIGSPVNKPGEGDPPFSNVEPTG